MADDPAMCGWLTKQGWYVKTWKRRWVVLDPATCHLRYYKESGMSSAPQGEVDVSLESHPYKASLGVAL